MRLTATELEPLTVSLAGDDIPTFRLSPLYCLSKKKFGLLSCAKYDGVIGLRLEFKWSS
jgi:hypothetical protein